LASGASFSAGAALPLLVVFIAPEKGLVAIVFGTALFFLAGLAQVPPFETKSHYF
jgi:VIT1/CCC1 family predicted Fe2+/Mn2+ transporter